MRINGTILFCSTALGVVLAGCSDAADPVPPGNQGDTTLSGSISEDRTLTADKEWTLGGVVFVEAGATLTIEPGTVIKGAASSLGTLVVEPGSRLMAQGTADAPIVFTSQAEPGDRLAGDWGGVILLGNAPINVPGGKAQVEGITGEGTQYGGDDPDDSSGVVEYVRIEYSGVQLSPDNEINGITFAGVGRGTRVDHVMVHHTTDDCFEFFGGTVDAKHLLCAYNGDDGVDWDLGYTGRLQYVAVVQDASIADDANGFEADNDGDATQNRPISSPTIYNATLCGQNKVVDKQQYGMLLRRSTEGTVVNTVITGFEACVDVGGALTDPVATSSICHGSTAPGVTIAYEETDTDEASKGKPTYDDDGGFDEVAWWNDPASGNSVTDPGLANCFRAGDPDFRPAVTLSEGAATPPEDGFFDASATYIGAFTADDGWATGAWVSFEAR
ncbi:hypothetical protein [Chondromyces apiculatus]|uniref:Lipoprotein n=1 Tax=Chondromyces apiculatus DSM 436 TaxID=1192034 RepID=A0A017T5S3_9BACT|nr:hypothetical protein [Chondromyces apiculatus]EYF04603.1 Hypothetical protein CAP_4279 [Chondromyces apiculatus DSM 436]